MVPVCDRFFVFGERPIGPATRVSTLISQHSSRLFFHLCPQAWLRVSWFTVNWNLIGAEPAAVACVNVFGYEAELSQSQLRMELDQYILERLGGLQIADDNWAARWLLSVSDRTTVITTNYDNIAESLLSRRPGVIHGTATPTCHHCRMRSILCEECTAGGRNGFAQNPFWAGGLLKLHGSVAWKMCENSSCQNGLCLPDIGCQVFREEACDLCKKPCSPVLVHPSLKKLFDRFRGLGKMWNGTYDALANCKTALFFGFSFPTSDVVLGEIIRFTLGRSRGPLEIGIADLRPDGPANCLRNLLDGRSPPFTISEFVVPCDGSVPAWARLDFATVPRCVF